MTLDAAARKLWEIDARQARRPQRAATLEPTTAVRIPEELPEVAELVEAAREAGVVADLGDRTRLAPAQPRPSCEKHGWGLPLPGQPQPPAHMCQHCRNEALPKPAAPRTGGETHSTKIGGSSATGLVGEVAYSKPQLSETAERELRKWRAREQAKGGVLPGSEEETKAVEHLDSLRHYERDAKPRLLYESADGKRRLYETKEQVARRLQRTPKPAFRKHIARQFGPTSLDYSEITLRA